MRVMQQVLSGDVRPPSAHVPDLPPAVDAMIVWLLSMDPRERPRCGPALLAQMERTLVAPDDVQGVERAREAHRRRCARDALLVTCTRVVGAVVGMVVTAWIVWETLKLQPAAEGTPEL